VKDPEKITSGSELGPEDLERRPLEDFGAAPEPDQEGQAHDQQR
jgi:hypothetical protein